MDSILGVSLNDYGVGSVFGGDGSMNELAELQKAISAGDITGRDTAGRTDVPGATLKVEDVENTLKILTFKESDIKLWKKVPKLPAYNTVEEYNQQNEYGQEGGSFIGETDTPEDDSPTYTRQAQIVKFMGTVRSVSHAATLVNTFVGDMMQKEISNGTMKLLRDANKALYFADSNIIPSEFNGFRAQQVNSIGGVDLWQKSDSVIDLRGGTLTEELMEQAQLSILNHNGEGNLFMGPPSVFSSFKNSLLPNKQFYQQVGQSPEFQAGLAVNKYLGQYGPIDLDFDKFMTNNLLPKTTASIASSAKAPAAPTADATTPVATATDALSQFTNFNGDYLYAVAAINRYGISPITVLNAAGAPITVAATQSVDLKFAAGGGTSSPTGYVIYRSKKGAVLTTVADVKFYPLFNVSVAQKANGYDNGAAGLVRDRNRFIPGTEQSLLVDSTEDVWSFKQLAPLMKMDLAIISPAQRFMLLLYGTPILYAPQKMVTFINVGV